MARWGCMKLTQLFLCLHILVSIKSFYSVQPYNAAQLQPPLTKIDLASSHPQLSIYHSLSYGEHHINSTLAFTDDHWLNAILILRLLAEIVMMALIAIIVYVLVMDIFYCCHLGVLWVISGRYT